MMAAESHIDIPVVIKIEERDTATEAHTAITTTLGECDIVQSPSKQLVKEDDGKDGLDSSEDCTASQVPEHLDLYKCGSCGTQFDGFYAIFDLHFHVQTHGLGGSYYYDHRSRTAYPKYDSVCNGTQTTPSAKILKFKVPIEKVSSGSGTVQCDENQISSSHSSLDLNEGQLEGRRQLRKRKLRNKTRRKAPSNGTAFKNKRKRGTMNDDTALRDCFIESSFTESTSGVMDKFTSSKLNNVLCRKSTEIDDLESKGHETDSADENTVDNLEGDAYTTKDLPSAPWGPLLRMQLEGVSVCNTEFEPVLETGSVEQEVNTYKPELDPVPQSHLAEVDSLSCYPDLITNVETCTMALETNQCKSEPNQVSQKEQGQLDICGSESSPYFDTGVEASITSPEKVIIVPKLTDKLTGIAVLKRNSCHSESDLDTKTDRNTCQTKSILCTSVKNETNSDSGELHNAMYGRKCNNRFGRATRYPINYKRLGSVGEYVLNSAARIRRNRDLCKSKSKNQTRNFNKATENKTISVAPKLEGTQNQDHNLENKKVVQVSLPRKPKKKRWRGIYPRPGTNRKGKEKGMRLFTEKVQNKDNFLKVVKNIHTSTCFKCKLVFHNKHHLEKHIKRHFGRLLCDCCNNAFYKIDKLREHLHEEGIPMKAVKILDCSSCGLIVTDLRALVAHLCTSTKKGELREQVVRMYTDKVVDKADDITEVVFLKDNVPLDTMENEMRCEICNLGFENEYFLTMHSVVHSHNKRCSNCRLCFMSDVDLELHKLACVNDSGFKCKDCGKEFCNKYKLKRHEETHINGTCDKCGKTTSLSSLKTHIASGYCTAGNDKDNRVTCTTCSKTYCNKLTLKRHIKVVHLDIRPHKWICEICGSAFRLSRILKGHMLTHQKDAPPCKCEICGASITERAMSRHMRLHSQQPRYTCEHCGKQFFESWNMKAHLRQHTGDKPYKCGKCGEGFAHNISRKTHMKKCCKVVELPAI